MLQAEGTQSSAGDRSACSDRRALRARSPSCSASRRSRSPASKTCA